ncbi:MAG: DUF3638 domain-containing protein, partial [Verrucomicrobia bacterium]|nr:DUF3638 domain-containing protein [Verrucomicrobiota bacterium]
MLKKDLIDAHTILKMSLEKAKEEILLLARLGPQDPEQAIKTERLEKGRVLHRVEFEELITRYIRGAYGDLNPHLKDDQLKELDVKIKEFLVGSTQMQQLERALKEKEISAIPDCLRQIAYVPSTNREERVFLVYEYRANLRIREEQVDGIRAMLRDEDVLLQMMMGGGKTTVLTSILLEAVDPEKICFLIPPEAQFETQVANLSEMQHRYYYKNVIPMNLKRGELTIEKLEWILSKFEDALKYKEAIITTSTTLESLQLEWISLLDRRSNTFSKEENIKINLLTQLLRTLKTKAVCLMDEVDQILDLFKELNFPTGDKVLVDEDYVDLIEKIFHFHLDPEIEDSIGLLRNEQSSFPVEEYRRKILPKVADQLFEHYKKKFRLEDSHKKAFLKFVLEGVEDKSFRALLERKMQGKDPKEERSAQLVFLTKGLFFHILPSIINKTENKNYGIPKGSKDRKVIPFLGVDSPSNTEFAGPYEMICYHNLTALSSPITEAQLHEVAVSFMQAVSPILQYTSINLCDTKEYNKFFDITGASLERIYHKDPVVMKKTLDYLKNHPEKRLELEKFFILKHVGINLNYYRSNPHSFYDLFLRRKGFTGTPWNHLTYPEPLRNNMLLQKGLEGSIRATFLQRIDEGMSRVHIVSTQDIQQILQISLQDKLRKDQFRALLDPIGFFKDKANEEVAQEILTYFEQDPNINTVLFFGRTEGNMGIPGTLMALRKPRGAQGKFSYEIIGSTEKESLEAKEINPENTIVYYDERHCEATDIPQIPNALGLVVVGSALIDRDFVQTNLRLRGYLKNQDVDLIISEKESKNYEKITGRDILTQMEVTQGIKSADEGFISFSQKMDNIFRQKAIEILLENPTPQIMEKVRDALITKQDVNPYASFGLENIYLSPLDSFKAQRKEKERQFSDLMDVSIKLKLDRLQNEIEKNSNRL